MITNRLPVTVISVMKEIKQMRVIVVTFDRTNSFEYVELEKTSEERFEDGKLE